MADAVDVDATGGNVGGNERAQLAVAEGCEHALALILRLVAVDRFGGMTGFLQTTYYFVGAMFGAGEHQDAIGLFGLEDLDQQRRLRGLFGEDDALLDTVDSRGLRRDGHASGIPQHRIGEPGDLLRHGGGEEQRLPRFRKHRDDLSDVVDEAHIEHAIGFVENQHFDLVEAQRTAIAPDRAGGQVWPRALRRRETARGSVD